MSHDKSKKHTFYQKSTCYSLVQACSAQFEVAVLWLVPAQSWGWRRFWHLLSSAGNTCLSSQSLVPVIAFRCHSFVSHSAYPSFWGLFGVMMWNGVLICGCSHSLKECAVTKEFCKHSLPVVSACNLLKYFRI